MGKLSNQEKSFFLVIIPTSVLSGQSKKGVNGIGYRITQTLQKEQRFQVLGQYLTMLQLSG